MIWQLLSPSPYWYGVLQPRSSPSNQSKWSNTQQCCTRIGNWGSDRFGGVSEYIQTYKYEPQMSISAFELCDGRFLRGLGDLMKQNLMYPVPSAISNPSCDSIVGSFLQCRCLALDSEARFLNRCIVTANELPKSDLQIFKFLRHILIATMASTCCGSVQDGAAGRSRDDLHEAAIHC